MKPIYHMFFHAWVILIPVSMSACQGGQKVAVPAVVHHRVNETRPVSKARVERDCATAQAAAIEKYGSTKAAKYMKFYRQAYELQVKDGPHAFHMITICVGDEDGSLEQAYRDGANDALKALQP
jgi:hypothetical protein